MQPKWVSKLLGYDFVVGYWKRSDSKGSIHPFKEGEVGETSSTLLMISIPTLDLLEKVKGSYQKDAVAQLLLDQVGHGVANPKYLVRERCLYYKSRLYVPGNYDLRLKFLNLLHNSPTGGHSGSDKTLSRVTSDLFWPGPKTEVRNFVKSSDICQRVKPENSLPGSLLQPLHIPTKPCTHISMDFIKGLPRSQSFNCIWVVVDRLTKYNHFTPLTQSYTTTILAHSFLKNIFKYHNMPNSIVSDRDKTFTSRFWTKLFK